MSADMATKQPEQAVERVERTRPGRMFVPYVDIVEKSDELLLLADMPGTKADQISIDYERGVLTIHAAVEPRQDETETTYLLREYGVGDFHRSFEIGEGINAEKIHAELKNGVLHLHLPKAEPYKPRKIQVRS